MHHLFPFIYCGIRNRREPIKTTTTRGKITTAEQTLLNHLTQTGPFEFLTLCLNGIRVASMHGKNLSEMRVSKSASEEEPRLLCCAVALCIPPGGRKTLESHLSSPGQKRNNSRKFGNFPLLS